MLKHFQIMCSDMKPSQPTLCAWRADQPRKRILFSKLPPIVECQLRSQSSSRKKFLTSAVNNLIENYYRSYGYELGMRFFSGS